MVEHDLTTFPLYRDLQNGANARVPGTQLPVLPHARNPIETPMFFFSHVLALQERLFVRNQFLIAAWAKSFLANFLRVSQRDWDLFAKHQHSS